MNSSATKDSSATKNSSATQDSSATKNAAARTRGAARGATRGGPWAVLSAAATVVLGPAAVTASALDQANAAPMHHARPS
ncbi:hypothetical protein [Streptomyces sp. NPDC006132]|uniref:hypothetical protein n=1 Tax=Streptomyces sp. NPDC006132 TaxID=3156732 RepID=UPI0033DD824D